MLQALGGLGYQALYQRILSAASTTQAQVTCYAAAVPFFIMGIPSVTIAAAASSAGKEPGKGKRWDRKQVFCSVKETQETGQRMFDDKRQSS